MKSISWLRGSFGIFTISLTKISGYTGKKCGILRWVSLRRMIFYPVTYIQKKVPIKT